MTPANKIKTHRFTLNFTFRLSRRIHLKAISNLPQMRPSSFLTHLTPQPKATISALWQQPLNKGRQLMKIYYTPKQQKTMDALRLDQQQSPQYTAMILKTATIALGNLFCKKDLPSSHRVLINVSFCQIYKIYESYEDALSALSTDDTLATNEDFKYVIMDIPSAITFFRNTIKDLANLL